MLKKLITNEYDSIAPSWRQKVWVNDSDFKNRIIKFAGIKNVGDLLDVGIGAGDLASLFNVKSITGIDISKAMLKECKKLHPNYNLILGDAEKLPFKNSSFDIVCCRNLLQNFNNPTRAFKEMFRVLKSGGNLIIIESAVYKVESEFPTAACRVVEPFHPLFPSHEELYKLFKNFHLRKIKQEVVGVHKKWLAKWQLSKKASSKQRLKIFKVCESYPEWYKKKYKIKLFPNEVEIESTLSFSFLKGQK
jgi:ubiquinone/menaquinone biosynthesis C-methylase UbiE